MHLHSPATGSRRVSSLASLEPAMQIACRIARYDNIGLLLKHGQTSHNKIGDFYGNGHCRAGWRSAAYCSVIPILRLCTLSAS